MFKMNSMVCAPGGDIFMLPRRANHSRVSAIQAKRSSIEANWSATTGATEANWVANKVNL